MRISSHRVRAEAMKWVRTNEKVTVRAACFMKHDGTKSDLAEDIL